MAGLCQQSPFSKFGKITAEDLRNKQYVIDSNAGAVVLSDIGKATIVENKKGWFSLLFTRHQVIHILNKNGYPMANMAISMYVDEGREEKLESIKGVSYNLENGKVEQTKLEKENIYREKVNKNWFVQRFTMPRVKEGTIIEIEYNILSDFIWHVAPWSFQGTAPHLWSEFNFIVPSFYSYAVSRQGSQPVYLQDRKDRIEYYAVTIYDTIKLNPIPEKIKISTNTSEFRWVMKDVPPLDEERFTSTLNNYISKLEFQLVAQRDPLVPVNFTLSWPDLTNRLLGSEYFGMWAKDPESWIPGEVKPVLGSASSGPEKARQIFSYVRDRYYSTGNTGIYAEQSMKDLIKSKSGSVAELNLLLVALLRSAGFLTDAVILSARDHGYIQENYPNIDRFNYVIVQVQAGNETFLLDASNKNLGFGKLHSSCYNGKAKVVNKVATSLVLSADTLREEKTTIVILSNDSSGIMRGNLVQTMGYNESIDIREKIKGQGREAFQEEVRKKVFSPLLVKSVSIDSLEESDFPLTLHYRLELDPPQAEGRIYFNPFLRESSANPFRSEKRSYPVEMPYITVDKYTLSMEVPVGYELEELPSPEEIRMDEKESASFQYHFLREGKTIKLESTFKINRTLFYPWEYDKLRSFYNEVEKKQGERIVFKKKQ